MAEIRDESVNNECHKTGDSVEGKLDTETANHETICTLSQDCIKLYIDKDNGNDNKPCNDCDKRNETESVGQNVDIVKETRSDSSKQTDNACSNTSEDTSHTFDSSTGYNYAEQIEGERADTLNTRRDGSPSLQDASLRTVDEDDGLLKFWGKACGVDKDKLLDEEELPYSKPTNKREKKRSSSAMQKPSDSVGERLAHAASRTISPSRPMSSTAYERRQGNVAGEDTHMGTSSANIESRVAENRGQTYYKRTEERRALSPRRDPHYDDSTKARNDIPQAINAHPESHTDEDRYNFTHMMRGYMVLVVNDKFDRQSPRDGALEDLRKMKAIGSKFGFRSLHYQMRERNLTKEELLNVLLEAQRKDHSDCDCLLLMISTHGLEMKNALKGGQKDHALVCSDEQMIFTSTILEMFNDKNCPSLKGKPKIFLIQACRGVDLDHGHDVFVFHPKKEDQTCSSTNTEKRPFRKRESFDVSDTRGGPDSWRVDRPHPTTGNTPAFYVPRVSGSSTATAGSWASSRTVQKIYTPTPYAIVDTPSLTCFSDMLVMYAIPPGMFAWRNTSEGSWMIDYLHQVLMSHDLRNPKSFLTLLTQVNAKMSHRSTYTPSAPGTHEKTAISVIEHKLCKDIIFDRNTPLSDWMR